MWQRPPVLPSTLPRSALVGHRAPGTLTTARNNSVFALRAQFPQCYRKRAHFRENLICWHLPVSLQRRCKNKLANHAAQSTADDICDEPSREKGIADINDEVRKSLVTRGRAYITVGVTALLPQTVGIFRSGRSTKTHASARNAAAIASRTAPGAG